MVGLNFFEKRNRVSRYHNTSSGPRGNRAELKKKFWAITPWSRTGIMIATRVML
jgi:hypothetical protein